jgi:hypothetical protein
VIQDAADKTRLGDEGDHAHEASAAGTDERIDLVDPSEKPNTISDFLACADYLVTEGRHHACAAGGIPGGARANSRSGHDHPAGQTSSRSPCTSAARRLATRKACTRTSSASALADGGPRVPAAAR